MRNLLRLGTGPALIVLAVGLFVGVRAQSPNPRQQPGAMVTMFAPEQHDLYDGHFVVDAGRIYMVGALNDAPGWDHMDNAAATVKPVSGRVAVDVDDDARRTLPFTIKGVGRVAGGEVLIDASASSITLDKREGIKTPLNFIKLAALSSVIAPLTKF